MANGYNNNKTWTQVKARLEAVRSHFSSDSKMSCSAGIIFPIKTFSTNDGLTTTLVLFFFRRFFVMPIFAIFRFMTHSFLLFSVHLYNKGYFVHEFAYFRYFIGIPSRDLKMTKCHLYVKELGVLVVSFLKRVFHMYFSTRKSPLSTFFIQRFNSYIFYSGLLAWIINEIVLSLSNS